MSDSIPQVTAITLGTLSRTQKPSDTSPVVIGPSAYVPHRISLSRVPPEIWTHIFTLVDDPPKVVTKARFNHPAVFWLGWIHLTHVCQYWRRLVLDNSTFWARIIFCLGTRWMSECFERSGSALLTVDMDAKQMPMDLSDVPLRHYRDRLRRLSLSTLQEPNVELEETLSFIAEGAPLLERLEIHCSAINATPVLPSSSSVSPFPNLRHLVTSGVQFSWTSFPFQNLITFAVALPGIWNSTVEINQNLTVSTLLNILERMPELKTLRITGVGMPTPQEQQISRGPSTSIDPPGRIVSLAQLEELTFKGSSIDGLQLRHSIKIPSSARSYFIIHESHDYELSALVDSLSTNSSPSYGAPLVLRATRIYTYKNGPIGLTADTNESTIKRPVYELLHNTSPVDAYSLLAPLCKGIFADIVDLHLINLSISDERQWQDVLEPLSLLRTLSYSSESPHIQQLLEALCAKRGSADDPQSTMTLLPALQTLHLDCPTQWTSRFTSCIQHRQRSGLRGAPLATLQLSNFAITEIHVAHLENCVPNLRVLGTTST